MAMPTPKRTAARNHAKALLKKYMRPLDEEGRLGIERDLNRLNHLYGEAAIELHARDASAGQAFAEAGHNLVDLTDAEAAHLGAGTRHAGFYARIKAMAIELGASA